MERIHGKRERRNENGECCSDSDDGHRADHRGSNPWDHHPAPGTVCCEPVLASDPGPVRTCGSLAWIQG